MRSHLAMVVVMALAGAACTHTLQARRPAPCPATETRTAAVNGIGIIGMSLDRHPDPAGSPELFVDRVVPEGPAARAGVRSGDRIYSIGDTSTEGMSVADAARRLRGPAGAAIALRVGSGDEQRDVTIIRVAPSDLWSRAAAEASNGERVHASDVAPAAAVAVPPCPR